MLPASLVLLLRSIPASAGQPGFGSVLTGWGDGLSPRVRGNRNRRYVPVKDFRSIPASAGQPMSLDNTIKESQVYPRECGATVFQQTPKCPVSGLSPRVRGNRPPPLPAPACPRSIPASAGQPLARSTSRRSEAVYPRECGATVRTRRPPTFTPGLSPRVRGNLSMARLLAQSAGSIPASAGQPPIIPLHRRNSRGLSPRVRGNQDQQANPDNTRRSIPASAGQPHDQQPVRGDTMVYPRECGATSCSAGHNRHLIGLSPRVRGNPYECYYRRPRCGSIPASAGQPYSRHASQAPCRVYPRECGATVPARFHIYISAGLSPRVRGNPSKRVCRLRGTGSIPASAGQPSRSPRPWCEKTVYPRECGATDTKWGYIVDVDGLSPRVRGNHGLHPRNERSSRSIPASAGQPYEVVGPELFESVYPRECGATCPFPVSDRR